MKNVYYCSFFVLPGQMTGGYGSEVEPGPQVKFKMADINIFRDMKLKIKI